MIDDREKITYAKSELKSYSYLKRKSKSLKLMEEGLQARLENVKSPSRPKDEGGGGYSPYRRAELFDDLVATQEERNVIKCRLDRIDKFIAGLDTEDKKTLNRIYLRREQSKVTLEEEALNRYMSRPTLVRHIDKLMKEF